VKDLIGKSNKGISTMIAFVGMIALLVVGLGILQVTINNFFL